MLTIPIILLNYNSSSDCRKCISFLKNQKNVEIEIVVVDNCSKSEDLCLLRTLCQEEQCTLIENKENRGYNAGNNIGLRYAVRKGYKYALITNPGHGVSTGGVSEAIGGCNGRTNGSSCNRK